MKKKLYKGKIKDIAIMSGSLLFFIGFWEVAVEVSKVSPIVLIKPSAIYPVILDNFDILLAELIYTLKEALLGWLIGNFIGLFISLITLLSKKIAEAIISLGVLISSIPLIALAAILGGFIGTGPEAKTVIVSILCFFPMLIVATGAFLKLNGDYKKLFEVYNSSGLQTFIKLILPSSLPAILNALQLNVVTALTTAIVSEFFGSHGGIGQFILARKGFYDLPMVWAAIFFVIISGCFFYFLTGFVKRLVINWS